MPTYEFRCPEGHVFDHFYRKMSDSVSELPCPECGKVATRQLSGGAGFVFKGSGFYLTDYGKNAHRGEAPGGAAKRDAAARGEGASESSSTESKPAASGESKSSETKSGGSNAGDKAGSTTKSGDSKSSETKPTGGRAAPTTPGPKTDK